MTMSPADVALAKLLDSVLHPAQLESSTSTPSIQTPSLIPRRTYLQTSPPQEYHSPYALADPLVAVSAGCTTPHTSATPEFSSEVNEVIARIRANGRTNNLPGLPQWKNAHESGTAEAGLHPSYDVSNMQNPIRTGGRRGRGPRRRGSPLTSGPSTVKLEDQGPSNASPSTRGQGASKRGRGGRPRGSRGTRGARGSLRGGKRKRTGEEGDNGAESDSSENYAPLPTQSRSGRRIFQASNGTPIISLDDEDLTLSPPAILSLSKGIGKAKQKSKFRRTPGATAVCKNCGRGHSPASNAIVFCDGCNKGWHQFCHDPPIPQNIILVAESQWFCSDCTVLREEQARLEGRVAGTNMSLVEKRRYLQGLPQIELVSLLLHACSLHPTLPLFAANAISSSKHTTLAGDNDYYEDAPLPYPKAGNGVCLRPESEDLASLVDDDTVTFSHTWKGVSEMVAAARENLLGMRASTLAVGA